MNDTLLLNVDEWAEITTADVTNITFQNLTECDLLVQATVGGEPTSTDGSIVYGHNEGERNVALSDLFPGVSGAVRVWARPDNVPYDYMETAEVFVSHA